MCKTNHLFKMRINSSKRDYQYTFNYIVIMKYFITTLLIPNTIGIHCLQTVRISAPDYIRFGEGLWLNCSCDLQLHQIYSIKWFKDSQEFYRFIVTEETEPKIFYNTSGIYPDISRSNLGNVYLVETDFKTEGEYKCQISSEISFQTLDDNKHIKVYYIPKDPTPVISGKDSLKRPQNYLNDLVNLTCSAPMSLPAAQLSASINGKSIMSGADQRFQYRIYYQKYENNLSSTSINIQFNSRHLTTRVPFECQSTIIHKQNRNVEINLWTRHKDPQQIHNNEENIFYIEDRLIGDNQTPEDSSEPTIDGLQPSYRLTDILNLTCVSSRYNPVPELKWLIDRKEVNPRHVTHLKPTYSDNGFGVQHSVLQYSLQNVRPKKTFKSNKFIVNIMCVESLTQVLTRGKETLDLISSVEPISDNTVGAVKSFMENTAIRTKLSSNTTFLTFLTFVFLLYNVQ